MRAKDRYFWGMLAFLGIGFIVTLKLREDQSNLGRRDQLTAKNGASDIRQDKVFQTRPRNAGPRMVIALPSDNEGAPTEPAPKPVTNETEFRQIISGTNGWSELSTISARQILLASDHEDVAKYFEAALDDYIGDQIDKRDDLLLVASHMPPESLSRFWQKIASRRPPLAEDETPSKDGHSFLDMKVNNEMLLAIKNIRSVATSDEGARTSLEILVAKPTAKAHSAAIRAQAFIALREIDSAATLRILKNLDPRDSLRELILREN
ncbi:MAG: hypothetical protein H7318_17785 [Oligoflexus sp.]|nr:hypothetical protein [Oligoflexus sp.]